MKITTIITLLIIATFPALAAVAPLSPAQLKEQTSHIVTGSVVGITSHIGKTAKGIHFDRIYTIRIKVETVSKGADLEVGSEIKVLAWRPSIRVPREVGSQGHDTIPKKGDRATFYLQGKGKKQFEPLVPNGIALVEEKPKAQNSKSRTNH